MSSNRNASFSVIIFFIVLLIVGCSLVPLLNVKLNPSRALPEISVQYYWPKASGRILEKEVTSRLEGVFNSIKGVKEIKSKSSTQGGSIQISFNKDTRMDVARFEVATLIRQVYPELPEGVSYPYIQVQIGDEDRRSLMVFTLNGSASPYFIQKYAEENLVSKLSLLRGVSDIEVYGAPPMSGRYAIKRKDCSSWGLVLLRLGKALLIFLSGANWVLPGNVPVNPKHQHYNRFTTPIRTILISCRKRFLWQKCRTGLSTWAM
jgi:multidrug efflux pump subunit AcrB